MRCGVDDVGCYAEIEVVLEALLMSMPLRVERLVGYMFEVFETLLGVSKKCRADLREFVVPLE